MGSKNPVILIVDDFKTTRDVLRNTLEKKGYKVIEAADGKDAVKSLESSPVDLVITDYNMPNLNGAQLVEFVRHSGNNSYIPVLILSTDISEEKKQNAMKAGATGWIKKPFEIATFMKVIEKVLNQ